MNPPENKPSIVIYQSKDGLTKLDVRLENETVWLTQMQICRLFDKSKATVSEHILKHVFEAGELDENAGVPFGIPNNCCRWKKLRYQNL